MGRIVYDVPLIRQEDNDICWVACAAMVTSERKNCSVGIGHFLQGLDPARASIGNPSSRRSQQVQFLSLWGFDTEAIDASNDGIERALRSYGPFILAHFCLGFPYGSWQPITDPLATHSVVVTGFDSAVNDGTCWINNPWGDKDQPVFSNAVINALNRFQGYGVGATSHYRVS
jgi:hypothetical protein